MRKRFVVGIALWIALWIALAGAASADVLRLRGVFDRLVDCTDTSPGSGCSVPAVPVNIPFTFSVEVNQPTEQGRFESTRWMAPEFPMAPPVTRSLFEGLAGHSFVQLTGSNAYENGPVFHNLLSFAGRLNIWSGVDAQGRTHTYVEGISASFVSTTERASPGTPITFDELRALWDDYRNTGRLLDVHTDVSYAITNPDGSFRAAGNRLTGHFRLCGAPGALAGMVAAVTSRVRGG